MYICLQYLHLQYIFNMFSMIDSSSSFTRSNMCRECTRKEGAPLPHSEKCKFAHINPVFAFTQAMRCIQCENMAIWLEANKSGQDFDEAPPAPRPHSKSCPLRP